jgi:mRNA degradation ribonuclease J1/J2
LGDAGVTLAIVDSLYAWDDRKTPSESVAREMLKDALLGFDSKGKAVIVTTFSSHIARLKSIIDFGRKLNRKIVFLGRSLAKYVEEEKQAQLKHRREDKESAANTVKQNLRRVSEDIEKIEKLGGSPSTTLLAKKDSLNKQLAEVKQVSDDQLLEGSRCNLTVVDLILGGE